MTHRTKGLAGLAATALLLVSATAAFGYAAQVAGTVTITTGPITCTAPVVITATVLETGTNLPIEGQTVNFGFQTSVAGDTISANSAVTNALGVATTTVQLACVTGNRTIFGVADDVRGSGVLSLTVTVAPSATTAPRPAAGLPNTATAPGAELAALIAVVVALGSGGVLVARRGLDRR